MLVILDRDGVINFDSPDYIKSPDEWVPIPGSIEAIAALKQAGHCVVLATNQAGVGRGLFSLETLNAIHQKLHVTLAEHNTKLDGLFFCPHAPDEDCLCRKPKPGMLKTIFREFSVSPDEAVYIGDSEKDIRAANAAGCRPILVKTGNGAIVAEQVGDLLKNISVFENLQAAASDLILSL